MSAAEDRPPSLFDKPEPRTHARREDPETSHDAARLLSAPRAGTLRRKLLAAYVSHPWGLTAEEATRAAGLDPADGAWKRVSDLRLAGLIRPTGQTRRGSSGRQQQVLVPTDEGWRLGGGRP